MRNRNSRNDFVFQTTNKQYRKVDLRENILTWPDLVAQRGKEFRWWEVASRGQYLAFRFREDANLGINFLIDVNVFSKMTPTMSPAS